MRERLGETDADIVCGQELRLHPNRLAGCREAARRAGWAAKVTPGLLTDAEGISGSVGGDLGHDLEEGSTFSVDVKVDKLVSWKFSCAACGANCTTTIPVVGEDVNFAMPDCPVPATAVPATVFEQLLPADSPTKGVKVTVSGTVGVKDSKGADVIALKIDATVQ